MGQSGSKKSSIHKLVRDEGKRGSTVMNGITPAMTSATLMATPFAAVAGPEDAALETVPTVFRWDLGGNQVCSML